MAQPNTVPQLESLVQRLPITEGNAGVFLALLELPYDLFRPIMDLLFAGRIFPEDLVDTAAAREAGLAQLLDGQAARAAFAAVQWDAGPAALAARAEAFALGRSRPQSVAVERDQTGVGLTPGGLPGGGFAPGAMVDLSYDAKLIYPNAVQLMEANGDFAAAQKAASAQFAAAMNPGVI